MNEQHLLIPNRERQLGKRRVVRNVLHGLFIVAAVLGAGFLLGSLV